MPALHAALDDLLAFADRHPDLWGTGSTATVWVEAKGLGMRADTRGAPPSAHARLARAHLVENLAEMARLCAPLGVPWGCPQFVLHIHTPSAGKPRWSAAWLPVEMRAEGWRADGYVQSPTLLSARADRLRTGPTGHALWVSLGQGQGDYTLRAGQAREALEAATALWHPRVQTSAQAVVAGRVRIGRVAAQNLTITPRTGENPDLLDHARAAIQAASAATRRWDFPDDRDFDTATLTLRTQFAHSGPRFLSPTPQSLAAQWDHPDPGGEGWCADHARVAQAEFLAFGRAVLDLPALDGAPLHIEAHITAIPGGDTLVRMAIDAPDTPDARPLIGESSWAGFARAWGPRLGGLAQLDRDRQRMWIVPARTSRGTRPLRAATPQQAAQAYALLWGETTTPTTFARLIELPSLAALGITQDHLDRNA